MMKWHKRYLKLAKMISAWSKDPRKKVGAVIVESRKIRGVGYNGFPQGIEDTESRLNDRAIKNLIMIHAEVNALHAADGHGDTIYVYPCLPCAQCLGNIIQGGNIKTVVTLPLDLESSWNQALVVELAREAKIELIHLTV
jgi:dCMP deaminase